MFSALDISATGLEARRLWMNTIAENLANAETTRDANGFPNPYRRLEPLFATNKVGNSVGVQVLDVVEDQAPFRFVFEPHHPDAIQQGDQKGFVRYPNINVVQEMVDMLMASRSYEANVTAVEASKSMFGSAMRILA